MRQDLAQKNLDAWRQFSKQIFTDGALPAKTKQLIAVAVAHVTQCPYCIRSHTQQALKSGATTQEIMEAIWWPPRCAPERLWPIRPWRWT